MSQDKITRLKNLIQILEKDSKELEDVLVSICDVLNINVKAVKGSSRAREQVEARQIFFYIVKEVIKTKATLNNIGGVVNRDHASVIYGCKMTKDLMYSSPIFKKKVDICIEAIGLGNLSSVDFNNIPQF